MTKAEFLAEHGVEWRKIARKPIFEALLSMIDDESPARHVTQLAETDKLAGSAVFLNDICGWEKLRQLLKGLGGESPSAKEPPDSFREPEIQ